MYKNQEIQIIRRNNLTDGDMLFKTSDEDCLTRSGVGQRISTLVRKAAATCPTLLEKKVTPHTFRHSVAMNMLQAGVDISSVAIYLGHESIETTHKYLVSDVEMKRKAFAKVHEVDGSPKDYKATKGILEFLESI
jgi:site-specific recombinase XerD